MNFPTLILMIKIIIVIIIKIIIIIITTKIIKVRTVRVTMTVTIANSHIKKSIITNAEINNKLKTTSEKLHGICGMTLQEEIVFIIVSLDLEGPGILHPHNVPIEGFYDVRLQGSWIGYRGRRRGWLVR